MAPMLAECLVMATLLLPAQSQADRLSDVTARIATFGRQLRTERAEDLPTYERAIAGGGPEELARLLTQVTTLVLDGNPAADVGSIRARLQRVYSPWKPTAYAQDGRYTATTPEVFRLSLNARPVVIVSWLIFLGRGHNSRFP